MRGKIKNLKLYRGLSADTFELLSRSRLTASRNGWRTVLERRFKGDFSYPQNMDAIIRELQEVSRLERQYFTDSKETACSYVRATNGILVQISVPLPDLLKHFRLEFQNFNSRRKKFEIVYVVDARTLARRSVFWEMRTKHLS